MSVGSRLCSGHGRVLAVATMVILATACASEADSTGSPEPLSTPVGVVEPPPSPADEPGSSDVAPAPAPASVSLSTPAVGAANRQHAAVDLEELLPSSVDGVDLVRESYAPDDFVAEQNEEDFAEFLEIAGRAREEVRLALAFDPAGTVLGQIRALRAAGTDADLLLEAVLADRWYASADRAQASVGGRTVTILTIPTEEGAVIEYLWVRDDVAFVVTGADPETAARFLEALP